MLERMFGKKDPKDAEDRTVALSAAEAGSIAADFAPLDEVEPGLSARVMSYVLRDGDPEVLTRLAGLSGCGAALRLVSCLGSLTEEQRKDGTLPPRRSFFRSTTCEDPALFYRLAMVYNAAARRDADRSFHWLVRFLQEASYGSVHLPMVERMLELGGEPSDLLRKVLLSPVGYERFWSDRGTSGPGPPGSDSLIQGHHDLVVEMLRRGDPSDLKAFFDEIIFNHISPDDFWEDIIALKDLADSAATPSPEDRALRGASLSWTDIAVPVMMRLARDGSIEQRARAAQTLARWCGTQAHAFLKVRSRVEPDEGVAKVVRGLAQGTAQRAEAIPRPVEYVLPPVGDVDPITPASPQVLLGLRALFQRYNRDKMERRAALAGNGMPGAGFGVVDDPDVQRMHGLLADTTAIGIHREFSLEDRIYMEEGIPDGKAEYLRPLLEEPDLSLLHILRLWLILGHGGFRIFGLPEHITYYRQHHGHKFTLRDLATALETLGIDPEDIAPDYLIRNDYQWEDGAVWPYFAERLGWLERALIRDATATYDALHRDRTARRNALRVVAMLPHTPATLVPTLWDIALGKAQEERELAQRILGRGEGFEGKVFAHLKDRDKVRRANAAEWLGRLRGLVATTKLEELVASDDEDLVKAKAAEALASMEMPTDEIVDKDTLVEEARRGMAKGHPQGVEWLELDSLPVARWADTGQPAPRDIVEWLVVRSFKLKDPAPDHLLRHYSSWFDRGDREAVAPYIMRRWVEHDTRPKYTREQADEMATRAMGKRPYPDESARKRQHSERLREYINQTVGNAGDSRGVLAVAGAFGGTELVPIVKDYLARWDGLRYHQCNYLMSALSWVDDPAAVSFLLSVSKRFRTKAIREHAIRLVEAISIRRGWSPDELGDRTIPTAGLDEDRTLALDYGSRRFLATLGDDLRLSLRDERGNGIDDLPGPGPDDNIELVEQAKKELKAATRELGTVVKDRGDRLYEAMCVQRVWAFSDWDELLNRHPIISRLCRRTVWSFQGPDGRAGTFRPDEDGSPIDASGGSIAVEQDALVRVAHALTVPPGAASDWARHLKTRRIKPLLDQFPEQPYVLPQEKAGAFELDDFLGHIVQGSKLTTMAKRLGYVPGPVLEETSFYEYRRKFESCGIEACIEFTGHPKFSDAYRVALKHMFFNQLAKRTPTDMSEMWNRARLGDVPPVLLSEAHGHMRRISDASLGRDPQWETQP